MKGVLTLGPEDGLIVNDEEGHVIEVDCRADRETLKRGQPVFDGHTRLYGRYEWLGNTDEQGRKVYEWQGWIGG